LKWRAHLSITHHQCKVNDLQNTSSKKVEYMADCTRQVSEITMQHATWVTVFSEELLTLYYDFHSPKLALSFAIYMYHAPMFYSFIFVDWKFIFNIRMCSSCQVLFHRLQPQICLLYPSNEWFALLSSTKVGNFGFKFPTFSFFAPTHKRIKREVEFSDEYVLYWHLLRIQESG
jgi:hypothetical protein